VRAHGLTKISEGGGVDGENIIVHRVALHDLPRFVQSKRDEGCVVDVKLLMLPGMLF
jgi:ADP-ribose pyrophosphatase